METASSAVCAGRFDLSACSGKLASAAIRDCFRRRHRRSSTSVSSIRSHPNVFASGLVACAVAFVSPTARAGDELAAMLDAHCIACHGGASTKGGLDLRPLRERSAKDAPLAVLRSVRTRLVHRDMPPETEERPLAIEYDLAIAAIDAEFAARAANVPPGRPTLRRLNRAEYRATVRDLVGVDPDVRSTLPPDDVGDGFDSLGDVLSMSPVHLEKYLDLAERIALRAWPLDDARLDERRTGTDLEVRSGGRSTKEAAIVWSSGAATTIVEVPRDGVYRVRFRGFGDQAGGEPVKTAIVVDRTHVAYFDLPERRGAPGSRTHELELAAGPRSIGIAFLNDFFDESLPQGSRDRNLVVLAIEIEGPLDHVEPTPELRSCGRDFDAFAREFLRRAFRRPLADDEIRAMLERVREAAGADAGEARLAQTLVVAALVDPRFLFRVERDAPEVRDLDDHELASRLSYFLWGTMPDAELRRAADEGRLRSLDVLRAQTERMLDDPRSIALAEQFGQQWLTIRGVDERELDRTLFPSADGALLADMKAETTLFLDALLREDRPIAEVMAAEWSFLNERLAKHYGIAGVDGAWMRRVRLGERRVPGLLGHGSVLVATSNPTRTSPVKRGKWVLEAMLDEPPPPPPPGVPQLPEEELARQATTVRELLEIHRRDPGCAGCHRRMDAIGLALEPLSVVGLLRSEDGGRPIDAVGDLPDGRVFDGPFELARMLADDEGLVRSTIRHMMVYALGRSLGDGDRLIVDRMARTLVDERRASFRAVVHAIVASDQFRRRSPAPTAVAHFEGEQP
jgi:hypothetical protein